MFILENVQDVKKITSCSFITHRKCVCLGYTFKLILLYDIHTYSNQFPHNFITSIFFFKNKYFGWFPCGRVVKTLHFQGRGCRFDPWLGNLVLSSTWCSALPKINKYIHEYFQTFYLKFCIFNFKTSIFMIIKIIDAYKNKNSENCKEEKLNHL